MRRVALYSSSRSSPGSVRSRGIPYAYPAREDIEKDETSQISVPDRPVLFSKLIRPNKYIYYVMVGALLALLLVWRLASMAPSPHRITQKDVERAVMQTMETQPLPSPAAKAYEIIKPSVVRVRILNRGPDGEQDIEESVGTGVVIVDKGLILTNLHVVDDAKLVKVVFADGLESEAEVVGGQPENDLAVLQAKTVPDDLAPANLGFTRSLAVGDHVVAVGFPFGIGPSVSAGVVSGLNREYRSPEGKRLLTNLIQFDAAVNPGNSGGPLLNGDGEVVGIVTSILNPTEQRVFIGIGFAVTIESATTAIGLPPF